MENILKKLDKIKDEDHNIWKNWSLEEKKLLLNIYLIISKKETHIFDLIYRYHCCDSWEDIFRVYDEEYLRDKVEDVEIAIKMIEEIEEDKYKENQISMDAKNWRDKNDFYRSYCNITNAPSWFGNNLDALLDSLRGGICEITPEKIIIRNLTFNIKN